MIGEAEDRPDKSFEPRVLIVEDMMLVAFDLAQNLSDWGYQVVGPFPSVAKALAPAAQEQLDCALLDVNLGGHTCFPIAAVLRERHVPFAFLTGHDISFIPEEFRDAPRIDKPARHEEVRALLTQLCCANRVPETHA